MGLMRDGGLSGFPGVGCAIVAALDGWEERLSFLWPEGEGCAIVTALDGWEERLSFLWSEGEGCAIVAVLDG